ncbi:MAG: 3-hydroxyacyl-CoA dehydrogenase family protein [Proteobacteria bacterium]|nr:3-hydroxyacyl-CoA dehydrogenase family protein [Pseudomonadota bacterium]MBU1582026.1 3-hydroxyacyl-CoA dehydrogenase family protein [Pseudomonadota bacterium]MBU2456213.1 3-hydroxyacyl-CoA dehydrogenase family protein [Pseudomonadota bacterium]MBU2632041.1 3-hydroxyacyl-CoA dehydrogenase family protein [Pseudomonadota bacterium]
MNAAIKEIGIIGKGKMGWDIFDNLYLNDFTIHLLCRTNDDKLKLKDKIKKQLNKKLKRNLITQDAYDNRVNHLHVSCDVSCLNACDLVIESVIENSEVKQNIFKALSGIVSDRCILASNTSSIPLDTIFLYENNKSRCFGLHFFYPLKLINTIEINIMDNNDKNRLSALKQFVGKIGKIYIEFSGEANFLLNKILLSLMVQAYRIYQENDLTMEDIDEILKENLFLLGLFEIMDSVGSDIILELAKNFTNKRNQCFNKPYIDWINTLVKKGYTGRTGVKDLYACHLNPGKTDFNRDQYQKEMIEKFQSLLINEIFYAESKGYAAKQDILNALTQILGIKKDPFEYADQYGYGNIYSNLISYYNGTHDIVYKPVENMFNAS